ncbi:GNAT family N-acetyltransferase [Luteimonas huabeiensis]|uniref:GNAT family N-acetyltransferase n=1 Tax=Luteimonas huabeiensis TaxID=1244513 RepID=UPI00046374C1|nr:GNAT family N-acetyltransferase [Luteimonas huabeiensis]
MRIQHDPGIDDPRVIALLEAHLRALAPTAPAESRHALDLDGLRRPEIAFWTAWEGEALLGCGALQALGAGHGEIKSMRTADAHLRRGVAARLLAHIVEEARRRGYARLSLETGSMAYFEPARRLYAAAGFVPCPPFGRYREDPNSVFMTLDLRAPATAAAAATPAS